ncbi:MAG: type II secretion system protein N [Pseudomonadota bacterium]
MKRLLLFLLFVVVFFGAMILTTPLSFVLEQSGARSTGLRWDGVSGTVFNGQVSGVSFGRQPIGNVSVSIRPSDMLKGRVAYHARWSGLPSVGEATLAVGRNSVAVSDLNTTVAVEHLVGLADDVRRAGGNASISSASVTFNGRACASASGAVSTDTVSRALATYGVTGGLLSGTLSCDGPMLSLPVSGSVDTGDRIEAEMRFGFTEPSSVEARVETSSPDIGNLLAFQGFEPRDGAYVYRQEAQLGQF